MDKEHLVALKVKLEQCGNACMMPKPLCVFGAGEEAVPTKKSKMIVSTSQMATSQTRVQRVS